MPRNRKYPTRSELRAFKVAMSGKSSAEQERLLKANQGLKDTLRRATALGATGRNRGTSVTVTSEIVRRVEKGHVPTGPKKPGA